MIGIIDYGMGNLKSIYKAFEFLGYPVKFITSPDGLDGLSGAVLPGVGAFPEAMDNLTGAGFPEAIKGFIKSGRPFLGICLGMQLIFELGFENKKRAGLGLLPGQINSIKGEVKVPHMGWNRLEISRPHFLWKGLSPEPYLYFVHSYVLDSITQDVIGTTNYGKTIPAAVARDNVIGLQFHPEKSGNEGLIILKNYGEML